MKIMISINKSKVPWDELMEACRKEAYVFNEMPLEWKMWVGNKEEGLITGIYYVEDEEALKKAMLAKKSELQLPFMVENVSTHVFDVIEDISKLNKTPI